MTTAVLVPMGTYTPQTVPLTGVIPDTATAVRLSVDRTAMTGVPGADVVSLMGEVSLDGGVTWQFLVKFTAPGGVLYSGVKPPAVPPVGMLPAAESSATIALPAGAARQYRATLQVLQTVTAAASVTWI